LLIDALWFGKRACVMLYRHSKKRIIIHLSFLKREYGSQIARDLKILKKKYRFTGVVSDGGRGILTAVFKVFGHTPHQICMAHLHRDIVNAIGRFPKDERVRKLQRIANHIWLIESKEALRWWSERLQKWTSSNRDFIWEKKWDHLGNCWYVHKGVRKAVRILVSLPDTSFKFLDRPLMPKTTNELEGSIIVLSRKHKLHKGLKRERVNSFIKWFVYFYNQKLLSQRKN
jgi:transposase-like protein